MSNLSQKETEAILQRHESVLRGSDIRKLEQLEHLKTLRAVSELAWKILTLVVPHAQKQERAREEARIWEERKQRSKNQRELLLLKMKGSVDEKLLANMEEEHFYLMLYVMMLDAPRILKKYESALWDSIRRAKKIAQLRWFASDFEEIALLIQCIPESKRNTIIEGIRNNTKSRFKPKN